MKNIKLLSGKEIGIIDNWKEVTGYRMDALQSALDLFAESEKSESSNKPWFIGLILACLSDVSINELKNQSYEWWSENMKEINEIISFINNPIENISEVNSFEIDGVNYLIEKDLGKMPTGKYIAIEKRVLSNKNIINEIQARNFNAISSAIAVAVNTNADYDEFSIDKRSEIIYHKCNIYTLIGALNFFLRILSHSKINFQFYFQLISQLRVNPKFKI